MATTTPNFGWPVPTSTDLVKDGATAMEALGDAIDTSMVDLKGGTTGQVLAKATNTDMDFVWSSPTTGDITGVTAGTGISGGGTSGDVTITNSMATAITTAGDLIKGTGSGTFDRLGIGTTGQVLTVSGGAPAWVTPAGGGGKVLQVVSASTTTEKSINSTSFTDTNLTVNITPSATSSKILVLASQSMYLGSGTTEWVNVGFRVMRGATQILDYSGTYDQANAIYTETVSGTTNATLANYLPVTYLDSPSSTSSLTYKMQVKMSSTADGRVCLCQQAGSASTIVVLEIGA